MNVRKKVIYIKIRSYKIKWNKIISSILSIGVWFGSVKIFFMILYTLKGWLPWLMPLIDYSEDSKYYYVVNGVSKLQHGNVLLSIGLIVDMSVFVFITLLLLRQNASKKLLIIEHSSLQHLSFSYDKDELQDYAIDKLAINQYDTVSNDTLTLIEKISLLIDEIENSVIKINEYVKKDYQIGYAGIPVNNIPSAFLLGYELDDANKKLFFHKNRTSASDDNFHLLRDDSVNIKLHPEKKKNNPEEKGKILLLIQLTQPINEADIQNILEDNDYILKYEVPHNVNYDIVNTAGQISEYTNQILADIADIQKSPNIAEIKICVAASSSFIFALGTKFSKTQNIDTVIYQFDKNRYSWGINVTKRKPITCMK